MQTFFHSRRSFIRKAALGTVAAFTIHETATAATAGAKIKKLQPEKGYTVLFQGDSITDSGRDRENTGFNTARNLGSGYALLAGSVLLHKYASMNLRVFNKGISGNKVFQLAERWDTDCLEMKPDILSILIGVNDIWHKLEGNYDGTAEVYKRDYIALIERTIKALPDLKLIICEPFAVPGVKAVDEKWYPEFYEYQKAAKEIALKFDTTFIPFQAVFDEAQKKAPGNWWTSDGVHPSLAGAQLMAEAWLSAFG